MLCGMNGTAVDLRLPDDFRAAYEQYNGDLKAMSADLDIPRRTLNNWKLNHERGIAWDGKFWVKPGDKDTPADPITSEVQRLKDAHERREDRVYTQEAARTEIILEHLTQAIRAMPAVKVKPPYFSSSGRRRSPMSLVVHLSDWHLGEVVDPVQVMGLNAYDGEIAARRVYRLEQLILTALDIIGRSHPIPTLRILTLGDMVSGAIHNELVETNEYNLYEQWANLALLLSQFVLRLAARFESVVIEGVPGNHGRTTIKPGAKSRYVSWDYLAYQTLALMLANQSNVTCRFPRSPLMTTEIEGWTYLLYHGDEIRSWAGLPWYGIERAQARLRELLQANKQEFHYAALGHFHNASNMERAVGQTIVNGSLVGGSEYSVGRLFSTSPPTQVLYFVHRQHGKTWGLRNDLSHGDDTPHPYILENGSSLADSYRKAVQ